MNTYEKTKRSLLGLTALETVVPVLLLLVLTGPASAFSFIIICEIPLAALWVFMASHYSLDFHNQVRLFFLFPVFSTLLSMLWVSVFAIWMVILLLMWGCIACVLSFIGMNSVMVYDRDFCPKVSKIPK